MRYHRRFSTTFVAFLLAGLGPGFRVPRLSGQTGEGVRKLSKRLIGDYGYWSRTQQPPYSSAQIPFATLTHINHAGVAFHAAGSLVIPGGFLDPELIERAHAARVKVLLLLGGDFQALEVHASTLNTLVANLQAFVCGNGYDGGVDIDWEYPSTTSDRKAFFTLMAALREAFPNPDYLISADVPPWEGTDTTLRALNRWSTSSTS
jgi:GH18 family chitinase